MSALTAAASDVLEVGSPPARRNSIRRGLKQTLNSMEQIMTDAIEQAAAALNQSQDAQQAASEVGKPQENSSTGTSNPSPATDAQQTTPTSSASSAPDSPNAAGGASVEQPPATDSASAAAVGESAELPRESHLLLLEHKLAAMHAKFKTGERIVIDEFEQILGHIKAVL